MKKERNYLKQLSKETKALKTPSMSTKQVNALITGKMIYSYVNGKLVKKFKANDFRGYLRQNLTPPDLMLLLIDNDGKFDFKSTKETEFSKTIYNIIDFEKEYQDIAQNYDKYSKLVNNIYCAMKEYNDKRNDKICPYIFIN